MKSLLVMWFLFKYVVSFFALDLIQHIFSLLNIFTRRTQIDAPQQHCHNKFEIKIKKRMEQRLPNENYCAAITEIKFCNFNFVKI